MCSIHSHIGLFRSGALSVSTLLAAQTVEISFVDEKRFLKRREIS